MKDVTARNFGLAIAYLIPGFIALGGVATVSQTVLAWLGGSETGGATVGGFLYVTLGSLAAGMAVSAIRWMIVDTGHHMSGLRRPQWDDSKLNGNLPAVEYLVATHYQYYQFYSNSFVAVLFTYIAWNSSRYAQTPSAWIWALVFIIAEFVFLAASRDALRKYYHRMSLLMGEK